MQEVLVHRDEILDSRVRIAGYRFRPVPLEAAGFPSASAKLRALQEDNLAGFAQRRMAIVPLKVEEWQSANFRQFITPNVIFQVEVPPPAGEIAPWLVGLKSIKASGAKIGLDSVIVFSHLSDALEFVDVILVKPADYPIDGFDRLVRHLRVHNPNVSIIVDGVYTWPEYRACLGLGAHYCLGTFATTSDIEDDSEALSPSRLLLIDMLNLLRTDAELSDLAARAKRDPGVAVRILELANSPLAGLKAGVASIDQAMIVVGRESLYRWVAMAIFRSGSGRQRDEALLEIALRRARFLELIGLSRASKKEADELFVIGLVSLMDKLLGLRIEQVLERVQLPQCVADVLLRYEGPYADYLMLALAMERGDAARVVRLAHGLELKPKTFLDANSAARAWSEQALGGN